MKKYEIEIDGQVYHVKVRELPDDAVMTEQPKAGSGRNTLLIPLPQTEGKNNVGADGRNHLAHPRQRGDNGSKKAKTSSSSKP
jgi:hypothetical protein